jgi:hypothetical protein
MDASRFRGTCYRAAGWQRLGSTRGFAKHGPGYVAHGQPKQVWVRGVGARLRNRSFGVSCKSSMPTAWTWKSVAG